MSISKYKISRQARKDLNEIWEYTFEHWSAKQADRYYKLIISEIKFIANNIYIGKPIDYIEKGYRSSKVNAHLIFYKLDSENKVEVIRILHEKMDIENRLEP